ncbi:MAG TPA: NAD(P)/FAD-dependent oxidoreductase [archaeon]|nr:NAD(P)/FAD-dependent oxidoreductase [archaeon]
MDKKFDVIIVGAGPAGAACSLFLAEKNLSVLLLDKASFPRNKTCGDGISGKSVSILKELNLSEKIELNSHKKIFGAIISSPNGEQAEIPISQEQGKKYAYCCERKIFDNLLFEEAKKKFSVIEEFNATDLIIENNFVTGIKGIHKKKEEMEFKSKIVVGADGANSIIAGKLNLKRNDSNHLALAARAYYENVAGLSDSIELHFLNELIPGYFWIFPLGQGKANVGLGIVSKYIKKNKINLVEKLEEIISKNEKISRRFLKAERVSEIKGWSLPLGSVNQKKTFNGALLLGDAASLIDPFTGEGIGNALLSAKIASKAIEEAVQSNDFSEKALSKYEKELKQSLEGEMKNSHLIQKALTNKFLINFLVNQAKKNQAVRKTISSMLTEEAPQAKVTPLKALKMLLFKK